MPSLDKELQASLTAFIEPAKATVWAAGLLTQASTDGSGAPRCAANQIGTALLPFGDSLFGGNLEHVLTE